MIANVVIGLLILVFILQPTIINDLYRSYGPRPKPVQPSVSNMPEGKYTWNDGSPHSDDVQIIFMQSKGYHIWRKIRNGVTKTPNVPFIENNDGTFTLKLTESPGHIVFAKKFRENAPHYFTSVNFRPDKINMYKVSDNPMA